jgi:hypothetical protein
MGLSGYQKAMAIARRVSEFAVVYRHKPRTKSTRAIEGMHTSYLLSAAFKYILPTKTGTRLDKISDSATLCQGQSYVGDTVCPM